MKKFTMFLASVATALFGFATTASAQYETEQQIPWVNHASTLDEALEAPNGIYLCYMQTVNGNTSYSFVTAGGRFGTQAVTTNRGMTLRHTASEQLCTILIQTGQRTIWDAMTIKAII